MYLIRCPRDGDYETMSKLLTQMGYRSTTEQIANRVQRIEKDDNQTIWLLDIQGELVGLIVLSKIYLLENDSQITRIETLIVEENKRRKGFGKKLIEFAEKWAVDNRAPIIELVSNRSREGAHRFYEKLGYRSSRYGFEKKINTME